MSDKITFTIHHIGVIVAIAGLSFGGGVFATFQITDLGERTYDPVIKPKVSPNVDLSCPKPKDFTQAIDVKYGSGNFNFIQAPSTNVNYNINDGEATVQIDNYAKPEGSSMRPTIFSGNTVLLKKFKGQDLHEGQIIRFETDSGPTIHRIEADYTDTEGFYLARGDNRASSEKVKPDQITHVVTGVLYTPEQESDASKLG